MRVLVCGGRNYGENHEPGFSPSVERSIRERTALWEKLDEIHARTPIAALGHGACGWNADKPSAMKPGCLRGADAIADEWAHEHGINPDRFPAHWTLFAGAAGPRRNTQMIDSFKPDLLVAAPGNRGTQDTVRKVIARKIPVEHVR